MILVFFKSWENLTNILHICPPHLSDVATLPWETKKSLKYIIWSMYEYYRWKQTFWISQGRMAKSDKLGRQMCKIFMSNFLRI